MFDPGDDYGTFLSRLDAGECERFDRLWTVLDSMLRGDKDLSATTAEALIRGMPDEEDGRGSLVVRTMAEALLARVRGQALAGGNLYLDARPPGAQLRAFELLRLRTPLISFAYAAGNRALLDAVPVPGEVTLLDVGIGRGQQTRALLRNPSARSLIRALRVIGVEPDSSATTGTGALEIAEQNVLSAAREAGVPTSFHAIPKRAEDLTADDLRAAGPQGLLLANCAFALHHVGEPGGDEPARRDGVLRTLREAGVKELVLVEPDSNHFVDDPAVRFLFAYRHYGTIAASLSAIMSIADAQLVWHEFFAAEVRNVMIHEGLQRTERHEELASWTARLAHTGWSNVELRDLVPQSAAPAGFEVRNRAGGSSLCFRGVPLLSVIRATAR